MEFVFALAVIILGLVAVDMAAMAWGVDSREGLGDDHRR